MDKEITFKAVTCAQCNGSGKIEQTEYTHRLKYLWVTVEAAWAWVLLLTPENPLELKADR